MALIGAHTPGATPLTEEDIRGLRLASITTQGELNEAEAQNILRGQEWALRSRTRALSDMLSDEYLLRLHQEMFGDVWKWAGKFRQRDTNIGVPSHLIRTSLRELCGSALRDPDANRKAYIDALVAADHRDLAPLLAFARSDGS
jgi:fido (protein-threonine AMPylation protein)